MSLNKYNKDTGELTTLASGTRMWIGTKSAHDLAAAAGTLPSNCLVSIIDDYKNTMIGEMKIWCGSSESVPSGWLYCDGSAISRATYSDLFNVIGTAFGSGDGSTTFNIPDMRESVPKGAGLTGHTVGAHLDENGLAVGEFLDDQIQNIGKMKAQATSGYSLQAGGIAGYINGKSDLRTGATTEVKSVGVNYIICYE